jgi:hypothetical protein
LDRSTEESIQISGRAVKTAARFQRKLSVGRVTVVLIPAGLPRPLRARVGCDPTGLLVFMPAMTGAVFMPATTGECGGVELVLSASIVERVTAPL